MVTKAKKNSPHALALKCLQFTVSKDETRPQLMGYYHCPDQRACISTNAYAATFSRYFYDDSLANLIISANEPQTIKGEYPKVSSIFNIDTFQSRPTNTIKLVTIQTQFKVPNKPMPIKAYFYDSTNPDRPDSLDISFDLRDAQKPLFCVNSHYLSPLAIFQSYKVHYTDNPLVPVIFELDNHDLSYYLVMPIKM